MSHSSTSFSKDQELEFIFIKFQSILFFTYETGILIILLLFIPSTKLEELGKDLFSKLKLNISQSLSLFSSK